MKWFCLKTQEAALLWLNKAERLFHEQKAHLQQVGMCVYVCTCVCVYVRDCMCEIAMRVFALTVCIFECKHSKGASMSRLLSRVDSY
jgi:hypothetical protein